jgi:hypothetical protein
MRKIPGYSRYLADDAGNIYGTVNNHGLPREPRKLKPHKNPSGYLQLHVRADVDADPAICAPGRRGQLVHVMVCLAFHGVRPSAGCEVDHINFDRTDNRPENLRWVLAAENRRRQRANPMRARGAAHHNAKLDETAVRQIRARRASGETLKSIAADYGVSLHAVWHATSGRQWRHVA